MPKPTFWKVRAVALRAIRPQGGSLNITSGHIARHTPRGAGSQGREAAVIDIAQDLLLRRLYEEGVLDNLAIKARRKLQRAEAKARK